MQVEDSSEPWVGIEYLGGLTGCPPDTLHSGEEALSTRALGHFFFKAHFSTRQGCLALTPDCLAVKGLYVRVIGDLNCHVSSARE